MKKILIVGLGSIAKKHIANIKHLYPNAFIYVVSSSGTIKSFEVDGIELVFSLEKAIHYQPDFAIIASPATFHAQHAALLIAANIPVLIEKPFTAEAQESKNLMEIAQSAKIPVKIAYCLRYLSTAKIVKKIIDEKKIGFIYNASAHVGQYLPSWRKDKDYRSSVSASKALGGGVLLELSHELDYLQWFLGDLYYHNSILRHTKELALEVEEIADVMLTTKTGCVCTVHMNFIQKNYQRHCYIIGEKGHIYWNLLNNSVWLYLNHQQEPIIFDESSWDRNSMYLLMIEEFVASIQKKDSDNMHLGDAYKTIELIEQIKKSATWETTQ